jgi:hypothetical protein
MGNPYEASTAFGVDAAQRVTRSRVEVDMHRIASESLPTVIRVTRAAFVVSVAVAGGLTACTGVHPVRAGAGTDVLRASPRLLTQRDLAPLGSMRLDDAVMRVRPELFSYHGREAAIYLDGHPASRSELHALTASSVVSVRMLSPGEAALHYGAIVGVEPILEVRTRRP